MSSARANTVHCPQCGGESTLRSGEQVFSCSFCGTALFFDRSRIVNHYRLPRLLDGDAARAALRRWMAGNDTVKDLDRKSTLEGLEAIAFPMWLFRSRRSASGGHEAVAVEPAAPTPIPALADLTVPAGELVPWSPEAGEPAETANGVRAAGAAGADPAAGERLEASIPLETAREWVAQRGFADVQETALVEVPLWRARYRYRNQGYAAVVEGSTGKVLASVYPEKAESPYVLVAVLGLVLFGLEGLFIQNPLFKLVADSLTSVPLLLLAWLVTRKV